MLDKIFFKDENYKITDYKDQDKINIYVKSKIREYKCPECGVNTTKYHSTYTRRIQDTPIHNTETWLNVTAYEFECCNEKCSTKTFTETLPFARKNKVKTDALIQFILGISIFLSSTASSLILSFMGVKISPDSIDNLIKNIKIVDNTNVEKVGIDDVAIRKGMSYATAIYDLDDHHLIALLEGRDAESVKEWLKAHNKIKVVARDRASAYAAAISEILPDCIQIADRFHLFENLIKYLKEIFYNELPEKIFIKDNKLIDEDEIVKVEVSKNIDEDVISKFEYDNTIPVDTNGVVVNFDSKSREIDCKQYKEQETRRIEKYNMVIELREKFRNNNVNLQELATEYSISTNLVSKYIKMTDEEVEKLKERKEYKKRKTVVDNYVNIIYKMIIDNIHYDYIIEYVIRKGYTGKISNINNYIRLIVKNNNLPYKYQVNIYRQYKYPDDITVITRHELLKGLLTIDENKKNKNIEDNLDAIGEKYSIVKEIRKIFNDFHGVMFGNNPDKLDDFIEQYKDRIPSFCNGLKKDIAPVKNAISSSISSGFVEGNNNKFKLIKRIVYGKMKLCNLFKRCYLSFLATTENFNIEEIVEAILSDEK